VKEKQIPPLRRGMTTKEHATARTAEQATGVGELPNYFSDGQDWETSGGEADSSAAVRMTTKKTSNGMDKEQATSKTTADSLRE
jgi:hypothetical protein